MYTLKKIAKISLAVLSKILYMIGTIIITLSCVCNYAHDNIGGGDEL